MRLTRAAESEGRKNTLEMAVQSPHSDYKTGNNTQHTVIKYLIRSTYTHAEEEFWPQGLQKHRSEQVNALRKAYLSILSTRIATKGKFWQPTASKATTRPTSEN